MMLIEIKKEINALKKELNDINNDIDICKYQVLYNNIITIPDGQYGQYLAFRHPEKAQLLLEKTYPQRVIEINESLSYLYSLEKEHNQTGNEVADFIIDCLKSIIFNLGEVASFERGTSRELEEYTHKETRRAFGIIESQREAIFDISKNSQFESIFSNIKETELTPKSVGVLIGIVKKSIKK